MLKSYYKRKMAPGVQQYMVEECLGKARDLFCWELNTEMKGQESQHLLGKANRQSRFNEGSNPL